MEISVEFGRCKGSGSDYTRKVGYKLSVDAPFCVRYCFFAASSHQWEAVMGTEIFQVPMAFLLQLL